MSFQNGNAPNGFGPAGRCSRAAKGFARPANVCLHGSSRPSLQRRPAIDRSHFAVALSRVLNPVMRSYGGFLFSDVKRVSADGRRLRIQLKTAGRRPRHPLGSPVRLPRADRLPCEPGGRSARGVGSGPYYIARHTPGSQLVIERNRYYKGPGRPESAGSSLPSPEAASRTASAPSKRDGRTFSAP